MKHIISLICFCFLLFNSSLSAELPEMQTSKKPLSVERLMHYLVDSAYVTPPGAVEGQSLSFMATSGGSKGFPTPLSYAVAPEYFGSYVCELNGSCKVTDYRSSDYSILSKDDQGFALQVERMNMTHGVVIYDAAVWQIAVALHGQKLGARDGEHYMAAAQAQTNYLIKGAFSDDQESFSNQNRAVTNKNSNLPLYNGTAIPSSQAHKAYTFRMVPKAWGLMDPFALSSNKTFLDKYIQVSGDNIIPGQITWLDWKGISGENAWAHFIGPLQTDYLDYMMQHPNARLEDVEFSTATLSNAVNVLHAVALLQSKVGAIYYAPEGSVGNTGNPVNPYEVSIENNASMLGGLLLLEKALEIHEQHALNEDNSFFSDGLQLVREILYGREASNGVYGETKGLMHFFLHTAWDAEHIRFNTHGLAYPDGRWVVPDHVVNAVDANSWLTAILGPKFIDEHLGEGTTYKIWQHLRPWGGFFDANHRLMGVGFDDSSRETGQKIMSAEWTLGAIGMLRTMQEYYTDPVILEEIGQDIVSMREGLTHLTTDNYSSSEVFAKDVPQSLSKDFVTLTYEQMVFPKISEQSQGLLYASKRYFIPFGWYANPVPSTASTAWAVMDHYDYNPFAFGGHYNGVSLDKVK